MFLFVRRFVHIGVFMLMVASAALAANDLQPEELVQRHLESIGSAETRAGAKSRVVEGIASYRLLVGGSGRIDGKAVCVSEGHKMQLLLKILASQYNGERFYSDGQRTFVEGTRADHSRSELGQFL